jgi:hypothetical protein
MSQKTSQIPEPARPTCRSRPRSSDDSSQVRQRVAPSSAGLLQRQVGNARLQLLARSGISSGPAPRIQRACACSGGGCASCTDDRKLQPSLKVGPVGDVYEQEADAVAERIMRMPDPSNQRGSAVAPPSIQRLSTGDAAGGETSETDLDFSGGAPLGETTRGFMESRFGTDFGSVRVHADERAQTKADALGARAFTYGNHIWLGAGESESDRRLMAHELTHVVQQGAAGPGEGTDLVASGGAAASDRVQRARLPCTTRTMVDIYTVQLPGSTRSIATDVTNANAILCQCGIELNVVGGQSWATNALDLDAPTGILNAPSSTTRPLTREETTILSYKPGGPDVLHVYYVPDFTGPKVAESFWPTEHGDRATIVGDTARDDTFAHEIGHVLMDDGGHHANPDNLMATGGVRRVGVDELEQTQCNRLP